MPISLKRALACAGLALCFGVAAFAASAQTRALSDFAQRQPGEPIPAAWQSLSFKNIKPTQYRLDERAGRIALCAHSEASASAMFTSLTMNAEPHAILRWSWIIDEVLAEGALGTKAGDDFAARVYVSFKYEPDEASLAQRLKYSAYKLLYGEYPPQAVINYVWANQAEIGRIEQSPYSQSSWMWVLQSGNARSGLWLSQERDINEDYQKIFKRPAPAISAIAVMSDSDNTQAGARACFSALSLEN